jgi:predicted RNA binding protein YcfA (HicA-like mRNA interferase family)
MTHLRRLSARDVLKALSHFGFQVIGAKGSHAKLRRVLPGGERQTLTIPTHKSLAPGTLHAIFRQACRYIPEAELWEWFFTEDR